MIHTEIYLQVFTRLSVCLSDCVILFSFPLFLTCVTVGVLCISENMCVCSSVKVVLTAHCAAVKLPVHAGVIVHSALQVGKVI